METRLEKEKLVKFIRDAYYLNPDMIRFLLIENLALKTLLHEKGLFTLEEYKQHQKAAAEMLEKKSREQMAENLKKMVESTPSDSPLSDASPSSSISQVPPQSAQQTPSPCS